MASKKIRRSFGDHLLRKEAENVKRKTVVDFFSYFGATIWLLVIAEIFDGTEMKDLQVWKFQIFFWSYSGQDSTLVESRRSNSKCFCQAYSYIAELFDGPSVKDTKFEKFRKFFHLWWKGER